MLIKDCMTKQVEVGNPSMSLTEVARKMNDGDFGILPIVENDRIVGMVTDRDIAVRGIAQGRDPNKLQVNDVMSKHVFYCYEDQSMEEVSQNLGKNQVRRLPVLNRQKRLVGILSIGDLAKSKINPQKFEEALQNISKKAS